MELYVKPNRRCEMEKNFEYTLLTTRMEEYRFSQNTLANAIGIGRTAMNLKFNNKSFFTQKEIRDICEVLDIPSNKVGKYFFEIKVRKTEFKKRG